MSGTHAVVFVKHGEEGLLSMARGRAKSLIPVFGGNRIVDSYVNPLLLAGVDRITVLSGGDGGEIRDYFLYRYGSEGIGVLAGAEALRFLASPFEVEAGRSVLLLRADGLLMVDWKALIGFLAGRPEGDYQLRTVRREPIGFFLKGADSLARAAESGKAAPEGPGESNFDGLWDSLRKALGKSAASVAFPAILFPLRTVTENYRSHFAILEGLATYIALPQLHPLDEADEKSICSVGAGGSVRGSYLAHSCVVEGHVERSILFPHVRVARNARVSGSIVMDYNSIGAGAVVRNAILCDNSELFARLNPNIGEGAAVGEAVEKGENARYPDFIHGGVTLIGRNVEVPRGFTVPGNCYIASGVGKGAFRGLERVKAGDTVIAA